MFVATFVRQIAWSTGRLHNRPLLVRETVDVLPAITLLPLDSMLCGIS
jgi:hypothetical protein